MVTCCVRDESGAQDLAGRTLTATLRKYGTGCVKGAAAATQAGIGTVTFPVTTDQMTHGLCDDLYRFDIDADGVNVYTAILEIV